MLHPQIRWLARRGIRWFYRRAECIGAEKIPASGATLLVATHGNDLTDILLALLVTRRNVLFVANVAAADSMLVKWTYAGLGVIPVARTRDTRALLSRGEDVAALNDRAFASVTQALKDGHIVVIFPEGVVNELPHLAPLRTGAARMALDAVANGVENLTLVPVGFQYESPTQPRSDVLTIVGDAVHVASWKAENENRAVAEFTRFIRQQLQPITRNSATWTDAEKLSATAAAVGASLSSASRSPLAAAHMVQLRVTVGQAAGGNFVSDAMVGNTSGADLQRTATVLNDIAASFGARRWSAADHATVLSAAGDARVPGDKPSELWLWISGPLAAFGWLWHVVPFQGCFWAARQTRPLREELAGRVIVPGLYVVVLWYASIPVVLLLLGVSRWLVLLLFIVQPRLGDFALEWRDRLRSVRLAQRVRRASAEEKFAVLQAAQSVRQSWLSAFS